MIFSQTIRIESLLSSFLESITIIIHKYREQFGFTCFLVLAAKPAVQQNYRSSRIMCMYRSKLRILRSLPPILDVIGIGTSASRTWHAKYPYTKYRGFPNTCVSHIFTLFSFKQKERHWTVPTLNQPRFILLAEVREHGIDRICT